jgi:hypothetical protein
MGLVKGWRNMRVPIGRGVVVVVVTLLGCGGPSSTTANSSSARASFADLRTFECPSSDLRIAAGDFNGDHILDVAKPGYDGVYVFLGVGDGTFQPSAWVAIDAAGGSGIAASDFNGDGLADLALVSHGAPTKQGGVAVLPATPDGSFGAPSYYDPEENDGAFDGVLLGDVNGDGRTDAVTCFAGGGVYERLAGSGGLGSMNDTMLFENVTISMTNGALADVNHDGRADLIVGGQEFALLSTIAVFYAGQDGSFSQGTLLGALDEPDAIAVGDVNGDGAADIVAATYSDVEVFLGDGAGSTALTPIATPYPANLGQFGAVTIADLDGDGRQDLVVASGSQAFALYGDGTGGFSNGGDVGALDLSTETVLVADFNEDGRLDIAASTADGFELLLGQ